MFPFTISGISFPCRCWPTWAVLSQRPVLLLLCPWAGCSLCFYCISPFEEFWSNTSFLNWNSLCFPVTTGSGTLLELCAAWPKTTSDEHHFKVNFFFFWPKLNWRELLALLDGFTFSSDQGLEGRVENRMWERTVQSTFCMSFFTITLITDKDAQAKFFWGPVSCRSPGQKSSIFHEALFSYLGSGIFGPPGICELLALDVLKFMWIF